MKATRYYSYGGDTIAQRTSTGVKAFFADQVGTSTTAIDWANFATVTRRLSDIYGNQLGLLNGPWANGRAFLDLPLDATTGLQDVGARKYDPTTGRFISVDRLLEPSNPLSLNGYSYTNADPVNDADPSGMWGWSSIKNGLSKAANGVKNVGAGAANYVVQSTIDIVQTVATVAVWATTNKSWSESYQTTNKYAQKAKNAYKKVEDKLGVDRNSKAYKAGYIAAAVVDTVFSVVVPGVGAARAAFKVAAKVAKMGMKAAAKSAARAAAQAAARAAKAARATAARAVSSAAQAARNSAQAVKRAAGTVAGKARGGTKAVPVDAMTAKLKGYVDTAVRDIDAGVGVTRKQKHHMQNAKTGAAYRGSLIDSRVKDAIEADPSLKHLYTTPNGVYGPDILDTTGSLIWWDITTTKQWGKHLTKYAPTFGYGIGLFTDR